MTANLSRHAFPVAIELVQVAALLWVLIRRRSMCPVLFVNFLLVIGVLLIVLPDLSGEIAYIREGEASELFDYKSTILTAFESVTFIASVIALRGLLLAKIVAWIGFAGNFALSFAAMLFLWTFEFKCCGYL